MEPPDTVESTSTSRRMSSSAIRRSTPRWNRDARNPPPESARPSFSGRTPLPADVATKTSSLRCARGEALSVRARVGAHRELLCEVAVYPQQPRLDLDRKSTRLNSSHL